jgi:hypothetical protein
MVQITKSLKEVEIFSRTFFIMKKSAFAVKKCVTRAKSVHGDLNIFDMYFASYFVNSCLLIN